MKTPARSYCLFLTLLLFIGSAFGQRGQSTDPIIQAGTTVQVSPRVYGIPDNYVPLVPNVGIVVGNEATLVVDTGLGENALLVIPRVQQEEMAEGEGIKNLFASRSEVTADLLRDVDYPRADILFEDEVVLDLGGLTARVFHLGTLHTQGDAFVYIEEENVLFAGDVIMQGLFPSLDANRGSIRLWQEVLNTLEALNPEVIIGAHGAFGGIEMIESWRQLFRTLMAEVRILKEQGIPEADAAAILTADFSTKYPQWPSDARRMNAAVRVAWRELP
ncbi:MAG: MBL fold metallo-hydrolase [Gammaproteobacteria bacterium]|mgnify:CR=1 FL=1|jgi:hypothetical protein|nr:hypothetical protein [Gammaproteobacteria bacterium]MBQ15295.1 hypothetical protein [Gammaproteobacteria bacterium]MDP6096741.1 MBL fold metallo-hydrolase [Gammaproteobacteria bacterium]HJO10962.1 MBL fold metallo-hydrolase [Gammaproteobacteria bacterium]|tara:strand:- start:222 stop:1046 length:825 start_codon:yes stop_codon:yes gene_type:complete